MKQCENSEITENLKVYFNSLKNTKSLTKKEEHELLRQYRYENNLSARDKLITCNLRYACKLASAYRNRGVCYSELISEANDGLIEAIDKFDLSKDVKIISYSKWWIMQKMQLAIEKKHRMPYSEIPEEKDTPFSKEDDITANEKPQFTKDDTFLIDAEVEEKEQDKNSFLNEILKVLNSRELDMINMYYGRCDYKEFTLDEISEKYNITKERVRQIIETAMKKLRSKALLVDCQYISR